MCVQWQIIGRINGTFCLCNLRTSSKFIHLSINVITDGSFLCLKNVLIVLLLLKD